MSFRFTLTHEMFRDGDVTEAVMSDGVCVCVCVMLILGLTYLYPPPEKKHFLCHGEVIKHPDSTRLFMQYGSVDLSSAEQQSHSDVSYTQLTSF